VNGVIVTTTVPGHLETFSGRDYTMARQGGNVAIRTLLPLSTLTTRIGGTGYEYWVNNTNYPPAGSIDTIHSTPGRWRLEVVPTQVADTLVFLHSVKIGDSTNPSFPGGTGQMNGFTIGADWENTLFFFNAQGDTGTDYHILTHIPGNRSIGMFAADLIPEHLFNILVDQAVIATLQTDRYGILQLQGGWLSSGDHIIEIEKNSGILPAIETVKLTTGLFSVFPNPADETLTFEVRHATGAILEFVLYTQQGTRVLQGKTRQKEVINVRHFTAGTYWIEAHDPTQRQVMKIVIEH
jgi:hypothetical protein